MSMVMAVSFTRYGRLCYLDAGGHEAKVGGLRDGVVVRLAASACRCSRADVCEPRRAYDSVRNDPQGAPSSDA
jgi:hypothetical protein